MSLFHFHVLGITPGLLLLLEVLLLALQPDSNETLIAASGPSCRHQIKDGTNKEVKHPVEILHDALAQ